MTNFWKLAAPAALALLVTACADRPAPMPMPAPVASAPVVPPSASVTVPETETAPARTTRRYGRGSRTGAGVRSTGPAAATEQTTAGPSAVGRQPAAAQPTGTGGS